MTNIVPQSSSGGNAPSFDPSQFKLQPDGTFRISIIGMARMAGVNDGSLSRSLKSASAENPLPCARSLVAQEFCPSAVSGWGETGGIPEEAVPFILEHYSNAANHAGIEANGKARMARLVLLSFARVGVNAYLKEKLGLLEPSQVRDTRPRLSEAQSSVEWLLSLSQRWGVKLDERDMLQIKQHAMSLALPPAGGAQHVFNDAPISRLVLELFGVVLASWQLIRIGKKMAARYRTQFKADPPKHDQYVDGANRAVAHYDRSWAEDQLRVLYAEDPTMFERQK